MTLFLGTMLIICDELSNVSPLDKLSPDMLTLLDLWLRDVLFLLPLFNSADILACLSRLRDFVNSIISSNLNKIIADIV